MAMWSAEPLPYLELLPDPQQSQPVLLALEHWGQMPGNICFLLQNLPTLGYELLGLYRIRQLPVFLSQETQSWKTMISFIQGQPCTGPN